jgi:hypothetical protein
VIDGNKASALAAASKLNNFIDGSPRGNELGRPDRDAPSLKTAFAETASFSAAIHRNERKL